MSAYKENRGSQKDNIMTVTYNQSNIIRLTKLDFIIILYLLLIFLFLQKNVISSNRFTYDEADYMYAVSKGLSANYFDKGAIPLSVFIEKGIDKGLNLSNKTNLSKFIRKSDDISFYRHYHGPLYFYYLSLLNRLKLETEYGVRWGSLLLLPIVSIAVFFLLQTYSQDNTAAIIGSFLMITSPSLIGAFRIITPHGFYILVSLLTLFLLSIFLKKNNLIYWYLSIIFMAFSFLTMEFALLILVTFILCIFVKGSELFKNDSRCDILLFFTKSLGLFILVIFILWPGALLNFTLLKNYLFFAYFAIIRGNLYGSFTILQLFSNRFITSPIEYLMMLPWLFSFIYVFIIKRGNNYLLPFMIYSLLIFLTTLKITSANPTYIASFLSVMFVISSVMIDNWLNYLKDSRIRRGLLLVLVIVILLNGMLYLYKERNRFMYETNNYTNKLIDYLKNHDLKVRKILIPSSYLPSVHFYYPYMEIEPFECESDGNDILNHIKYNLIDGLICEGNINKLMLILAEYSINVNIYNIAIDSNYDGKKNLMYLAIIK